MLNSGGARISVVGGGGGGGNMEWGKKKRTKNAFSLIIHERRGQLICVFRVISLIILHNIERVLSKVSDFKKV